MGFEAGHDKFKGRTAGKKNKNTLIKERIFEMVESHFDDFIESYDMLRPNKKCETFLKLLEFIQPKMSSVKFEDGDASNSASDLLRIRSQFNEESQE